MLASETVEMRDGRKVHDMVPSPELALLIDRAVDTLRFGNLDCYHRNSETNAQLPRTYGQLV
ncbi:hypothetical protein A5730_16460 [Mycobacterium sp. ACS4054]|nr:hypothetical protein A5730_16460 [Mycobacterium sp. ACS4054]